MRLRQLVATHGFWAWCIVAFGVVATALMWGCVRLGIPDQPINREWWPAALVLGPYLLAAVSLGIDPAASPAGLFDKACDLIFFRVPAGAVVLCGLVFLGWVVADFAPTVLNGSRPPDIPGSLHVVAFGLFVQYPAALTMLLYRTLFR